MRVVILQHVSSSRTHAGGCTGAAAAAAAANTTCGLNTETQQNVARRATSELYGSEIKIRHDKCNQHIGDGDDDEKMTH